MAEIVKKRELVKSYARRARRRPKDPGTGQFVGRRKAAALKAADKRIKQRAKVKASKRQRRLL